MRFLFQGYRHLLTHPRYGIWVMLASLLYLISPIDLSPDLMPLLGQIDDVALIVLILSVASQWLGQQFLRQPASESAADMNRDGEAVRETVDVKAVEVDATEI
ncbi:DUF1232 domain-containing protein [Oscillatoria sp. CS-180]|uniref:YkvA family protein n=1 Tax=Oscillatoria sp. CS-180 TaxID=3021720 RepID=UPI002330DF77|nr:DUF1232 domain-containing protein [Oscillatoria sp. CS-180]MDB9526223.1 DUF1232 domain-containing protein [Oscillatoria sp. CS-180]